MDDAYLKRRRSLLLAALGGTALLPLGCAVRPAAAPEAVLTPVPDLLPWGPQITPDLFLTVSSRERDVAELESLVRSAVLPVLAPADVAQAAGPIAGAIQLWMMLEPGRLQHHGLDVDRALALLKDAMGGSIGPVPGRHQLEAWVLDRPGHKTLAADDITLALPDQPYAPLFVLGTTQYTLMPTAWREQACFSFFIQARSRLDATFLQRCEGLLQSAGDALPADLEIQIGKIDDPLLTLPSLFVEVTDAPWGMR